MNAHVVTRFAVAAFGAIVTGSMVNVSPAEAGRLKNFNLMGTPPETASAFDFTVDGITLTVSGISEKGSGEVRKTVHGLGVVDGIGPDNQIDLWGGLEKLLLNFDQEVTLVSATFGLVNASGDDQFSLFVEDNLLVEGAYIPVDTNVFSFKDLEYEQKTAKSFGFTAYNILPQGDDYTLKSITVATVPEPTTVLGLMAVGALASVGLKRKS
ncbi:MAG: PEP-CTERM sorting domain-containing protein [Lyngbya sp.]|nr:PEP-CTERM sorting domain-containing protein [Lyngbya sp.]